MSKNKKCSCGAVISANKLQCLLCSETGRAPLTPEGKIEYVSKIVAKLLRTGKPQDVTCPYCNVSWTWNEGTPICCMLFAAATQVFTHHIDTTERMNLAKRIAETL